MSEFYSFCCWVVFHRMYISISICLSFYISHIFFIHSPVNGHLGCFCILAIVNTIAMNIWVNVSFQINVFAFFRYVSRNGIAGSYGSSSFSFWGTSILFSIAAAPIYIPTFSPIFVVCRLFHDSHSDMCEVIFHCASDLHFSDDQQCWVSFHVPVGQLYVFENMSIQIFCPFLIN